MKLKFAFAERLDGVKRSASIQFPRHSPLPPSCSSPSPSFCATHTLPLPPPIAPLLDINMQTVAMETLTEELQPLVTVCLCVYIYTCMYMCMYVCVCIVCMCMYNVQCIFVCTAIYNNYALKCVKVHVRWIYTLS